MSPTGATRPELPWHDWEPTVSTVHRWLQILGRVRMVLVPRQPHWRHVLLRVTEFGFSTGSIPHATGDFRIEMHLLDQRVDVVRGRRSAFTMAIEPMSVATFYERLLGGLDAAGIDIVIPTHPPEGASGAPLDRDAEHASYVPAHAIAMWRGFADADRLLRVFRGKHRGWSEPRLYWSSFDVAINRYSEAPASEQMVGWWPTSAAIGPAFYAYTKPEPPRYRTAPLRPAAARFDHGFGEFILTSDDVDRLPDPEAATLAFFESTARAGRPR